MSHDFVESDEEILFASPDIGDEEVRAVVRVLRSGWLTTGQESRAFEAELATYLGADHVIAVSSCTAAIEIAIAYLQLEPGARVGVPAWTFASTALAVHRQGGVPVLLDVDEDTLNLSVSSLAASSHDDLAAVVPVHFAGVPITQSVIEYLTSRGLPMVEDAAHALGATDSRGKIGSASSAGACFSFYVTKNLASGEGGAIATSDPGLAAFAESYRLHGMDKDAWRRYQPGASSQYDIQFPGIKANFPDLFAALARVQLSRFDDMQHTRRNLVRHYRERIRAIERVSVIPAIETEGSADHLMVVALDASVDRAVVTAGLHEHRIGSSVHFRPLHHFSWFRSNAFVGSGGLTVCDLLAERVLSLPLHSRMTLDDVDRVCDVLHQALR